MRAACLLARRDFYARCASLSALGLGVLFVLVAHALFWFLGYPVGEDRVLGLWEGRTASLQALFAWLPLLFVLLAPALAMSAWAEERQSGTDELLASWPIGTRAAVWGKFLGAAALLGLMLCAALLPLALVVDQLGPLDWGAALGGLAGAWLLGAACLALALCVSALARDTMVAFLLAGVLLGALWSLPQFARVLPGSAAQFAWQWSPQAHYLRSAARGLFDLSDVFYFALVVLLALEWNRLVLEARRWQ